MTQRYADSTSPPREPGPEPVGTLVGRVKGKLETEFRSVFVEGEVSNMSRPTSGHLYFTLKDERGQIGCVMWKSNAELLRFRPTDGLAVRLRGGVTVYPARGQMQVVVRSMVPAGEGALQKAFAELGRRLAAEGLFAKERKRPLPRFPRTVGVITSRSGAAVRDILTVLKRRFPIARVVVCPVTVQGEEASFQIVDALGAFNRLAMDDSQRPDVLILARGGGSLEDLWAFNEERTVRAVHASGIPVVCGVGHETDTTLADLVADVRAATPSMAAELAVPDAAELHSGLQELNRRHRLLVLERLTRARDLVHRARRVREHGHPRVRIAAARHLLEQAMLRQSRAATFKVRNVRSQVEARMARWHAANPLRPLEKGFALIEIAGRRIEAAASLPVGERFMVTFRDGSVEAESVRNVPERASFMEAGPEKSSK